MIMIQPEAFYQQFRSDALTSALKFEYYFIEYETYKGTSLWYPANRAAIVILQKCKISIQLDPVDGFWWFPIGK